MSRKIIVCLTVWAVWLTVAQASLGLQSAEHSFPACAYQDAADSEQDFRARDAAIQSEFVAAVRQKRNGCLSMKKYSALVRKLHKRELELFSDVKKHEFNDITEYNYWYRGRMKFPSTLEQEAQWLKNPKGPAPEP